VFYKKKKLIKMGILSKLGLKIKNKKNKKKPKNKTLSKKGLKKKKKY
jgi:hypothetical protein